MMMMMMMIIISGALKNYSADFLPLKMEAYRIVGICMTNTGFCSLHDCFTRHDCHYYKLDLKERITLKL